MGNPRKPQRGEIHVLTPQEASALLQTAERHFPQAVCIYAVALFAGVRAEEIQRLDAVHFNDEGIEIPANLSQKGLRRHVPMNSTLRAWLDVYPFEPCMNWVEVDKAVRRLAGWDVAARILKAPPQLRLVGLGFRTFCATPTPVPQSPMVRLWRIFCSVSVTATGPSFYGATTWAGTR